jgi:subtilisin family serine protease
MPTAIPGANNSAQCEAGESSGLLSWVIQGIDDAISNHADVISLSFGLIVDVSTGDGAGVKAAFDRVAYAAMRTGAVLVAAAGNDGYNLSNTRYIEIPAQSRGVLAVVAATNSDCMENTRSGAACIPGPPSLAYYSNYGAPLDALAAPGGSYPSGGDMAVSGWVRGACSSGLPNTTDGLPIDSGHSFGCFDIGHAAYVQAIGTSASAPLVAGAAALLRAAHPDWDSIKIVDTLRSTATLATPALPIPEVNLTNALAAP